MAVTAQTAGSTWYAKARRRARQPAEPFARWASDVTVCKADGSSEVVPAYTSTRVLEILGKRPTGRANDHM